MVKIFCFKTDACVVLTVQFCHRMEVDQVDPLYIKQEKVPEKLPEFDAILLCPNCNEVFRRQAALTSHRKSCDNCLKFIKEDGKCSICGWNDESKSIFRHLRQEHKNMILTQPKKQKIKNLVKLKVQI